MYKNKELLHKSFRKATSIFFTKEFDYDTFYTNDAFDNVTRAYENVNEEDLTETVEELAEIFYKLLDKQCTDNDTSVCQVCGSNDIVACNYEPESASIEVICHNCCGHYNEVYCLKEVELLH